MALQAQMNIAMLTQAGVMAGTVVPFGTITEGRKCSGHMPVPSMLNIL